MRIDIITLFEDLFTPFLNLGVTRRAFEASAQEPASIQVKCWNPRDFATGPYRRVDDRPFGGGPGMVMMAEPLALCLARICEDRLLSDPSFTRARVPVLLFTPVGEKLTHSVVEREGAREDGAIWICGRYEGIDQRFIDAHVDLEISLGDFVLSGGELPALALLDSMARLRPGVLGEPQSHLQDSFNPTLEGLLDCPHYTRPEVWQGREVPGVLMSGHHAQIEQWRESERLRLTQARRPDLLPKGSGSKVKKRF
jgi:tRNA (guanine37-N1)-methyltransferase